eukprot:NODE_3711_length_1301_cov_41.432937_g3246_i0.p1 GENE.NODE_3711_length_1301_cov_41.432937_g3246_i0~~NODE_3711_length_1301_cov_41.432937_g3246_i0.p1  ORF type:complete len:318 (+),score=60.33 NODE_3711_length_1301_cov_41.432937_g3246_i0:66-956(+)
MYRSSAVARCVRLVSKPQYTAVRWFANAGDKPFQPGGAPHPLFAKPHVPREQWDGCVIMPHQIYSKEELHQVTVTHEPPKDTMDQIAYACVKVLRWGFDTFSGYRFGKLNELKLLRRIIFLETVAGVPGMVAGSVRHLKSLRTMKRDRGWIHSLVEEAENERMHMLTFMYLAKPGVIFRNCVTIAQFLFWNTFFLAYLISPRFCHRFVGYLEEEAVRTYTHAIEAVETGELPLFTNIQPPEIAMAYWKLPPNATIRDLLLNVRADEAVHRDVNHTFSRIEPTDQNPFIVKEPSHKN